MLGTQQGHLLKDALLDLGDHQPHQHVQGGSAHIQAGSVGEVFLQVVKGTCMREKLLIATGLVSRRVRLLDHQGFPTGITGGEEPATPLAHQTPHHNRWVKRLGVPPLLSKPSLCPQLSTPKPWVTTVPGPFFPQLLTARSASLLSPAGTSLLPHGKRKPFGWLLGHPSSSSSHTEAAWCQPALGSWSLGEALSPSLFV